LSRLYYIRGILRKRLTYCNDWLALQLLQKAVEQGMTLESLERQARGIRNWSEWRTNMETFIDSDDEEGIGQENKN